MGDRTALPRRHAALETEGSLPRGLRKSRWQSESRGLRDLRRLSESKGLRKSRKQSESRGLSKPSGLSRLIASVRRSPMRSGRAPMQKVCGTKKAETAWKAEKLGKLGELRKGNRNTEVMCEAV